MCHTVSYNLLKRPAGSASGGNAAKRKHVTLALLQKVSILKKLERGTSVRALCAEYDVGLSTVYDVNLVLL